MLVTHVGMGFLGDADGFESFMYLKIIPNLFSFIGCNKLMDSSGWTWVESCLWSIVGALSGVL